MQPPDGRKTVQRRKIFRLEQGAFLAEAGKQQAGGVEQHGVLQGNGVDVHFALDFIGHAPAVDDADGPFLTDGFDHLVEQGFALGFVLEKDEIPLSQVIVGGGIEAGGDDLLDQVKVDFTRGKLADGVTSGNSLVNVHSFLCRCGWFLPVERSEFEAGDDGAVVGSGGLAADDGVVGDPFGFGKDAAPFDGYAAQLGVEVGGGGEQGIGIGELKMRGREKRFSQFIVAMRKLMAIRWFPPEELILKKTNRNKSLIGRINQPRRVDIST